MCGIIGAFNYGKHKNKPANQFVIDQYQDQISRGSRGFGAVMIKPTGEYEVFRATADSKILLDLYMHKAPMIIMHHRQPTSSENKLSQTHPIMIEHGCFKHKYLLIHNGMLYRYSDMQKYHQNELGINYTTLRKVDSTFKKQEFNDSECLGIELARFVEKQTEQVMVDGSYAFIMLQINKKTNRIINVLYGRNRNPLHLGRRQGEIKMSSEGPGEDIKPDTLYSLDLKTMQTKKRDMPQVPEDDFKKLFCPNTPIASFQRALPPVVSNYGRTRTSHYPSAYDYNDDYDPYADDYDSDYPYTKGYLKKELEGTGKLDQDDDPPTDGPEDEVEEMEIPGDDDPVTNSIEDIAAELETALNTYVQNFIDSLLVPESIWRGNLNNNLTRFLSKMARTAKDSISDIEDVVLDSFALKAEEYAEEAENDADDIKLNHGKGKEKEKGDMNEDRAVVFKDEDEEDGEELAPSQPVLGFAGKYHSK